MIRNYHLSIGMSIIEDKILMRQREINNNNDNIIIYKDSQVLSVERLKMLSVSKS